jgi:HSP20 family protein
MARQRTMLVNIERMRRDIDELLGEVWAPSGSAARGSDFQPRADVYYCESGETGRPTAVVVADLAGVADDAVNIEVSGRVLLISGRRPVRRTEGRAYQQVEIPTGSFRRAIELGVDIDAADARATFADGLLKVELPIRLPESGSRTVPIEPAG